MMIRINGEMTKCYTELTFSVEDHQANEHNSNIIRDIYFYNVSCVTRRTKYRDGNRDVP